MTPEKMDLRIENVVKLMRERLLSTSELKFRKYKRILTRRIGKRDRSLMRRTKRLWNEIITNRRYFNIFQIVRKFSLNIEKKDLIKFFDKLFSKDLAKLSIQEFSSPVKLVPRTSLKVNGLKGILIKTKNFFRKRNKYLKL